MSKEQFYQTIIVEAYKQATMTRFILKCIEYKKGLSLLGIVVFVSLAIFMILSFSFVLIVLLSTVLAIIAYWVGNSTAKELCKNKPVFALYQTNRQGARYCIFSDFLRRKGITNIECLEIIRDILEVDSKFQDDLSKRPIWYVVLGSIIASIGGLSSTSSKIGLLVLVILLVLFFLLTVLVDPTYSRHRELVTFLEWYLLDLKLENCVEHSKSSSSP